MTQIKIYIYINMTNFGRCGTIRGGEKMEIMKYLKRDIRKESLRTYHTEASIEFEITGFLEQSNHNHKRKNHGNYQKLSKKSSRT